MYKCISDCTLRPQTELSRVQAMIDTLSTFFACRSQVRKWRMLCGQFKYQKSCQSTFSRQNARWSIR